MIPDYFIMKCLFALIFSISIAAADTVDSGNPEEFNCWQARKIQQCLPSPWKKLPGMGIHLGAEYATLSLALPSGEVQSIARVNGSEEYGSLMNSYMDFTCPNRFENLSSWQKLLFSFERINRWIRKLSGNPAAAEVKIIADMMKSLISEVPDGSEIPAAVVTLDYYPRLNWEDVEDAAEYAGVKLLYTQRLDERDTVTAAYIGSGMDPCPNRTESGDCLPETIDHRNILKISLDATRFSLHQGRCSMFFQSCYSYSWLRAEKDWGWLSDKRKNDPQNYFHDISNAVQVILSDMMIPNHYKLDGIILYGDYATEPEFLEAVKVGARYADRGGGIDLRAKPSSPDEVKTTEFHLPYDPVFVVSRGAAQIARHVLLSQDEYNQGMGCIASWMPWWVRHQRPPSMDPLPEQPF